MPNYAIHPIIFIAFVVTHTGRLRSEEAATKRDWRKNSYYIYPLLPLGRNIKRLAPRTYSPLVDWHSVPKIYTISVGTGRCGQKTRDVNHMQIRNRCSQWTNAMALSHSHLEVSLKHIDAVASFFFRELIMSFQMFSFSPSNKHHLRPSSFKGIFQGNQKSCRYIACLPPGYTLLIFV